jgi:D-3-phosphoglycerate dehydrogenase / 2-oxoglutarate reductase
MIERVKVTVTDYLEDNLDWEAEELARRGVDFSFLQLSHAPPAELAAATADADVVVANFAKITAEVIAGWKRCRRVIRHGTGYDNFDLDELSRRGIPLAYIPDYCIEEVAEHAIALIFACGRRICASREVLEKSAGNVQWSFEGMVPVYRLSARTIGIIGCGRIGSMVLKKIQSLGCRILVCDPYLSSERKRELGIEVHDQDHVFREADFITLHTPLNSETRHLVNADMLGLMKPTAYLVNTSRGPVVDTEVLAAALKSGKIAGAGIDVYDTDPPGRGHPLFSLPNAVLTPHSAWYSEDAAWNIRKLILLEIDRFLQGLPPRYDAVAERASAGDR